jgi:basic membrane lipoprotein Med (substrate-binding protein (PBP1-ABC) superfamily)
LIAREVQKPGFTGKVFSLGLHDNVVTFVLNPRMTGIVPQQILSAVDSTRRQMIAGSFAAKLLPDSAQPGTSK